MSTGGIRRSAHLRSCLTSGWQSICQTREAKEVRQLLKFADHLISPALTIVILIDAVLEVHPLTNYRVGSTHVSCDAGAGVHLGGHRC